MKEISDKNMVDLNFGCPCIYTEPCNAHCTCVTGTSSFGCLRCCRYGNLEQRKSAALRLVALEKRFPCGHRVCDWDNGHGECVACVFQQRAADYERLPRTVIECHDEIERLEKLIEQYEPEDQEWTTARPKVRVFRS